MADRDREAARDGAAIWRVFPKTLAEIVAKARAEGAAEMKERAARVIDEIQVAKRSSGATNVSVIPASTVRARIRALPPTGDGLVVVGREDAKLAVSALVMAAGRWQFNEEEPLPVAAKMADDAADRIRAALARKGET